MKDRWKAVASLLEEEFGIKVQPSYEGWGSGWDPRHLPLLEMWAKGEVEEIHPEARRPKGVVFNVVDLLRRKEEEVVNVLRHELSYLLGTHFPHWRIGQREVFRAGYVPTSFLVLFSVLESIKADERVIERNPSATASLKNRYKEILKEIEASYPHHQLALSFVYRWIGEEVPFGPEIRRLAEVMERPFREYLKEKDPQTSYDIVMEELWVRFRNTVERSKSLNYVDLLIDEARGRRREAHRGRIMTDVLKKLPEKVESLIREFTNAGATEMPEEYVGAVLKALGTLPDWMREYVHQMSYLDLLERDLRFLKHFLPKTLEVDVEHRGFLSFIFKGWEEEPVGPLREARSREDLTERDRRFLKEHGLTEGEFRRYKALMRSVLPYVDHFRRKFDNLLPQSEERWGGAYPKGRRLNFKKIPTEVPIRRGKIYMRRDVPDRKELAFELILDVSSSMKKEDKITEALRSLILFSEVLYKLGMPFSVKVFNENVYELKSFEEDYKEAKGRIVEVASKVGGGTDLGKAIAVGLESLEVFTKKRKSRGILILFTDGEPTRGIRGEELKAFITQMKQKFPIVGIGVGPATRTVKEYFERTGISVDDISKLPSAFSFVIENQLRRLLSVS